MVGSNTGGGGGGGDSGFTERVLSLSSFRPGLSALIPRPTTNCAHAQFSKSVTGRVDGKSPQLYSKLGVME